MSGSRIASGGLVDRSKPLNFTFDGKSCSGFDGDTVASALLAGGIRTVGRSFKYHRARGVWGGWFDDPNAIFNIAHGGNEVPNCHATTTALEDGMQARTVNAWPSARIDIKGVLDLFHHWLPAGFYYKMFMWPDWHLFEPTIRKMAGLGRLDMASIDNHVADQVNLECSLLVVGGGAAGLAAARAANEAGEDVILVDDHPVPGGGLYRRGGTIEGKTPSRWVGEQVAAIRSAGGRVVASTTAFGVYDHGLVALVEDRGFAVAPRLSRVRAGRTILAAGATDRPATFASNDLPGIMSVEAVAEYLGRYGVLVGKKIVVASNNSFAERSAASLEAAGANVTRIDLSEGPIEAIGRKELHSVRQGDRNIVADVMAVSSGWTPLVHLWRHAGGKLRWSEAHSAFLPGDPPQNMTAIGAANGTFDPEQALEEARAVALGKKWKQRKESYSIVPHWPEPGSKGRQWIDFQHDVTLKDVELAARENFVSVEHLKRYTTLGMAADQGKTSNMAGLAAMAAIRGKQIPEVGTTAFRPPFVPVPLELYRGQHRGQLFRPLKRLSLESRHRAASAAMGEYGGWLRPGWYGPKPVDQAIAGEAMAARNAVSVLDASPLGKIEVMGPDAEAFVNFMYYNTMKTLKPGFIRYGFMLTEGGVVFDDGVVARMGPDRFVISCSSSHVEGVYLNLEGWRQDGNDPDRIFVHDTTFHWSTVTLSGPRARDVMKTLELDIDLSPEAFPHMTFRETNWKGRPLRVARVSFTGDVSFEMSIGSKHVGKLWDAVMAVAQPMGGSPIGIEALSLLRAEKGYIMVGKDTDGETMPHDLGFGVPRIKKTAAFVGDRSLHTDEGNDPKRKALVGLQVEAGQSPLPTGAHIISPGAQPLSLGFVTSSYDSPVLGRPIALALLEKGNERMGETVSLVHLGDTLEATVVSTCAFDPDGGRLHA